MADEPANDAGERPGKPWLLIAIVALLSGGGGAAGAYFLAPGPGGTEAQEGGAPEPTGPAPFAERLLALDSFVVNVGDEGYPRYLKLQLALELDSVRTREVLEERVPQLRDMAILLLSSRRLGELSTFEGKALLKQDIRERVESLVEDGAVEAVLFTEFVVQ